MNDFKLPFPITFTQMTWFVVSLFAVMLLGNVPPLSMIDGAFLKYFGIPLTLTWFMCQKTFDGKKTYGFLKSVIAYLVRPKLTYAGKTAAKGGCLCHSRARAAATFHQGTQFHLKRESTRKEKSRTAAEVKKGEKK